jgi:hypothetical protein
MAFLASLCAYQLNDLPEAVELLSVMQHTPYTNGVFIYLNAELNGLLQSERESILKEVLPTDIATSIIEDFSVKTDVIGRVINYCSYGCDNCLSDCSQREVSNLYIKLLDSESSYQ